MGDYSQNLSPAFSQKELLSRLDELAIINELERNHILVACPQAILVHSYYLHSLSHNPTMHYCLITLGNGGGVVEDRNLGFERPHWLDLRLPSHHYNALSQVLLV